MKKYLNPTVMRKDITRFAPLWGLYTVFMVLFLLVQWNGSSSAAHFMNNASGIMQMMGTVNFIYAGLCAITLFGDLFNTRMCNMLHAMPVSREGWFWSHFTAGLLFSLVPNTVGALLTATFLGQYAYGAFLWLAVSLLQFLFYFGVAIFSVMCVGNKLGMVSVYAIINFLGSLTGGFIKTFYEEPLYGITVRTTKFARLSPLIRFVDGQYLLTDYDKFTETTILREIPAEPWIHAGVAAAVGLVFLVLALLVYRKRAMETAGDLISLKPATPVFLGIYTLCVGLVFYVIADALAGGLDWFFLVVGLAIGYFTGRMLLEKQVAVFRWKNIRNYLVVVGVFALSLVLTWMDPIGITRFVPEADQVESVRIYPYDHGVSYDFWETMDASYLYGDTVLLAEPTDVETVIGIHKKALEERDVIGGHSLNLRYKMKDGSEVVRTYQISDAAAKPLQSIYSRPENLLGFSNPDKLLESVGTLEVWSWDEQEIIPKIYLSLGREDAGDREDWTQVRILESFPEDPMARGLVEAIYDDCAAGNLAKWYNRSESLGEITLQCGNYQTYRRINITIYENSENLLNYLKNLKIE